MTRAPLPGRYYQLHAWILPIRAAAPRYAELETNLPAPGIGYLRISAFDNGMWDMRATSALILDLRGNAGGDDEMMLNMASAFLAQRATIVGETSRGRDLEGTADRLPTGAIFGFATGQPETPKGFVIEGHGVAPDVDAPLTAGAFACRCDPRLAAAVRVAATLRRATPASTSPSGPPSRRAGRESTSRPR